ncbi:MAG: phosphatase PAP2 family protein [Ignavibacteriales bacterium]|nr:phosphatase PAP2 family protein [Ignavibacteriales bacterium]
MILATASFTLVRIFSITLLVIALTHACMSQEFERQPVFFDDDLQQINLNLPLEQQLNLDILNRQEPLRWHSMFTQLPNNWARSAGISLKMESVPALAGIGVLTFSLIQTDEHTWRSTRRLYRTSETFCEASDYAVALGDGRVHLGIATAFAGYGLLGDDPKALRVASQTVEAFLATGIAVQILKRVTGRESPAAASAHRTGRWKFFPHPSNYESSPPSYYAFPSGHISTTMATLTVIAENYPQARWIKPVGYTLVAVLGVGLVAKGMHWYSDLPLGIALGYIFGKVAANPSIPDFVKGPNEKGVDISITPLLDGMGGGGVHLAMAF